MNDVVLSKDLNLDPIPASLGNLLDRYGIGIPDRIPENIWYQSVNTGGYAPSQPIFES